MRILFALRTLMYSLQLHTFMQMYYLHRYFTIESQDSFHSDNTYIMPWKLGCIHSKVASFKPSMKLFNALK